MTLGKNINSMTDSQVQKRNDAVKPKCPFLRIDTFRAIGERLLTKIMSEAKMANTI